MVKTKLEEFSKRFRELKNTGAKLQAEQASVFEQMFGERVKELQEKQKAFDLEFIEFIETELKAEGDLHGSDLILLALEALKREPGLILPR